MPASEASCPACGTLLDPATHEEFRPAVTVVFCDIVDSMKLDAELEALPLRRWLDRFYDTAQRIFSSHGGAVGTRHGDGLMAVFGIPTPHDDDALRAVRAASELREALSQLSAELESSHNIPLLARIGVNTGTVLINTKGTSIEDQVTGHVVNLARRFEQSAGPKGILIGEGTYSLVRDAVRAEQTAPLRLKGMPEPVVAYRIHRVTPDVPGRMRRLDRPLIGRDLELRLLTDMFERTVAERLCHLVAVLGPAGIGKSRLIDQFVHELGDQATVLRGHCLSYGKSFWPIMQIVTQAAGIAPTDPIEVVYERLARPLLDSDRAREIALRIAPLIGLPAGSGLPGGDTYSALRTFLEALARRRPLIVFIDDLHWAEPSVLDTIDHIAGTSQGVPLMLLCLARPEELRKGRERWPSGGPNTLCVSLSPLRESEGERLLEHMLGGRRLDVEVLAYIWELTEGNPFYVEEVVESLVGEGILRLAEGRWVATTADLDNLATPRTIEPLLTVRLARLSEMERSIIERASVVGKQFHTADIVALSHDLQPSEVADCLEALALENLIDRDHSAVFPLPAVQGGDGYSFRHILIRNAAYERMTEEVRADRHRRYANWVEETAGDRLSQFDELIAYHLSEAYEYQHKLGPVDASARELARRGGERFAAAGRRAASRGDIRLTLALLGNASRLLPREDPSRIAALSDLAGALQATGELQRALEVYDELVAEARAGREVEAAHAALDRVWLLAFTDVERFVRDGRHEAERAISVLARAHDDVGLAKAWNVLASIECFLGRAAEASAAAARARGLAQGAGDRAQEARAVRLYCQILLSGEVPVAEVTQRARQALAVARSNGLRSMEAGALITLAQTAAMAGDFETAREHSNEAGAITLELGELLTHAADAAVEGMVLLLQEEPAEAEEALRKGYEALERMDASTPRAAIALLLGRVLMAQGRYAEAEGMIEVCERLGAPEHVEVQVKRQSLRAALLAHRGRLEEAERSARAAVELAESTDQLDSQAQSHADLAAILRIATRREEAIQEFERALRLYRRKGNDTGVRAVRRELINLRR